MPDTNSQPYAPTAKPARKGFSLWFWLLILVIAIAVLAGAVFAVGGLDQAAKLLGLSGFGLPSGNGSGPSPSAPAVSTPASTTPSASLPPEAQAIMFSEQVESRAALSELVANNITSLSLGSPVTAEDSATIPVTATFENGKTQHAHMGLRQFGKTWYFFSFIRNDGHVTRTVPDPGSIDSDVVKTITAEQGEPDTQALIKDGILGGGFREIKIDSVQMGEHTATVDLTLQGGSQPETKGRLVCISKDDSGITYWFVAQFEKR